MVDRKPKVKPSPRAGTPPPESPTRVTYDKDMPLLVVRRAVLRVVAGPDKGACCPLSVQRVRVGTAADNDLVLGDPGVSRHHLEFQVHDRGYLVCDLESTNGTFFRGARVREVLLGFAAELRLGETVLRVERGEELTGRITASPSFGALIGTSPAMQQVYGILASVAPTDTTVLLLGETGTGKEIAAEALHRHSPRRNNKLSVLDCGALPSSLVESEIFGHERGAFTGAVAERVGIFERTRGGTVFLDEIGELPLELQTRLLRVLDRREIRRVGGDLPRRVDVRLIAATHRNLEKEVAQGTFRRDLYYRLSVVCVTLPALRERPEDIPALARHFLIQAGAANPDAVLTPELLRVLGNRHWPGNVRELRNVIERAVVFVDGSAGEPPEIAVDEQTGGSEDGPAAERLGASRVATSKGDDLWLARALPAELLNQSYKEVRELLMEQFDTLYLGRLVDRFGNNISAIAREADLDRHMLRRLLRKRRLYPRSAGGDDV